MTKSDDELGDLLRETFVDKENQVDHLPEAIKTPAANRRRFTPVLAGAAAVVIVLGGAFVVRQNLPQPTTLPAPVATPSTPYADNEDPEVIALTEDIRIWAAAVKAIIEREPGASTYYLIDATQENEGAVRGKPFTDGQKTAITGLVAPSKLEWIRERPAKPDPCGPDAGGPYVNVGKIVRTAGHVEIDAGIWRGCLSARWLTFRLDEQAGAWKITGTIGPEAIS